jgi:hypothetical protein
MIDVVRPVTEAKTDVAVRFQLPGVSAEQREAVGAAYMGLYTRLWDEDGAMMCEREARLLQRTEGAGARVRLALGSVAALLERPPVRSLWVAVPFT